MSMPPFVFGREVDAFDPFALDVSHPDPFVGFPFSSYSTSAFYPSPLTAGRRASFPYTAAGRDLSPFARAATRVDWKETPAAHVFKADVPGLRKDEVKVEVVDGRVLQISGERTLERREKTDTWHCVERGSGMFLKRFQLPENAQMDKVTAAMENGVLTVTVPKEEEEPGKANVRSIEISG